jgi:hypothetical protein
MNAKGQRRLMAVSAAMIALAAVITAVSLVVRTPRDARRVAAAGPVEAVAVAGDLRAVTSELAEASAVVWAGTVAATASENRNGVYDFGVMVARNGAMLGSMEVKDAAGERVASARVIAVAGHTMLQGDEEFWRWTGVLDQRLARFEGRWVVLHDGFFGFDLSEQLRPDVLFAEPPAGTPDPVQGMPEMDGAVEVRPVQWNKATYRITTADPKRLVRLTTARVELQPLPAKHERAVGSFDQLRRETKVLIEARNYGDQPDRAGHMQAAFTPDEVARMSADLDQDLKRYGF